MTEGKLYKQLSEQYLSEIYGAYIENQFTKEMLDEAKREFPVNHADQRVKEWFSKYLGDTL